MITEEQKEKENDILGMLFKNPLQGAYWIRNQENHKIHGVKIIFEDGSLISISSENPVFVDLVDGNHGSVQSNT